MADNEQEVVQEEVQETPTIQLKNARRPSDVTVRLRLSDNGVAVDWRSLSDISVRAWSVDQGAFAGKCVPTVDSEDPTILSVLYPASETQFLGVAKLVVSARYDGRFKSYDVPVINFVSSTEEATGYQVIEDPEMDVAISVEDESEVSVHLEVADVSTSLLDQAIQDAEDAATAANTAAASATSAAAAANAAAAEGPYIGNNGNWFVKEDGSWIDSGSPARGPQGEQGIQGIQGPEGERGPAGVTSVEVSVAASTGTPSGSASVSDGLLSLSFSGLKGEQGIQGIQGVQGVQGEPGPAGVTSATVSVDANTGTPSATASVSNGVLSLEFHNL